MYDSENFPNNIAIGAEEKLNEDDKLPTIPKSEVVIATKDVKKVGHRR